MARQQLFSRQRIALLAAGLIVFAVMCAAVFLRKSNPCVQPTSNRELQSRVQAATGRALGAVVCIGDATGTIISPDGLILSQSHVTHDGRKDGESVRVIFSDGTESTARLVASNRLADVSLSKLHGSGPFPFLKLTPKSPRLGDYVMKLGHPGGWQPQRGMVTRLGRVVSTEPNFWATDCLTTGGDSGGPFLDLNGELVGMVGFSVGDWPGADVPYELHATIGASRLSRLSSEFAHRQAETARVFTMTPADQLRSIVDQLIDKGSQEGQSATSVQEPVARSGHWPPTVASTKVLSYCDWMSGARHVHRIAERVGGPASTIQYRLVAFCDQNRILQWGFFVDDVHVVTRASTLPEKFDAFACNEKLPVPVELAKTIENKGLDLVLLRAPARKFPTSVDWATEAPSVGTVVIARFGGNRQPLVGIVSVGLRKTKEPKQQPDDIDILPDGEFESYVDTDLPLFSHEIGTPIVDIEGKCIGIAIRQSFTGTRLIPAASIGAWIELIRTDENRTRP